MGDMYGMVALSPKEEQFCQHFVERNSGPAAYVHAYNTANSKPSTIASEASRLLADPKITARLEELRAAVAAAAPVTLTVAQALGEWIEIANADPNELIGLKVGACRYCWGDGHGYHWKEREWWEAVATAERDGQPLPDIGGGFDPPYRKTAPVNPDCPTCEGEGVERVVARDTSKLSPGARRLYGGVKVKRDGLEIIIADQVKARENANRIIGAFTDKVRLDGSISAMVAAIDVRDKSPQEAAKAYMEMVASIAVK